MSANDSRHLANRNPLLLHTITVSNRHCSVFFRLMINGYAKGSADGIHPAVPLSNSILFLIKAAELGFTRIHDLPGDLGEAIFLGKWKDRQFNGGELCRESQYNPAI